MFKNVNFGATLTIALVRAVIASFVIAVFLFISQPNTPNAGILIMMPVVLLLGFLPISLFASGLSRIGVPFTGLVGLLFAIPLMCGDPVIWLTRNVKPDFLDVEEFKIINPSFIYVLNRPI